VSSPDSPSEPRARAVALGAQLKAARLAARKSMAEVADQAGLSKGFLSKLERGLANVSVATLLRICDALDLSIGSLLQTSPGEIVRAGARAPVNLAGIGSTLYLLTPPRERRLQAILVEIAPGGGSREAYSMPVDVTFAFVVAGRLHVTVEGEEVVLEQGDAFTFAGGAKHALRASEGGPAQVLLVHTPALPESRLTGRQLPRGAAAQ